MRRVLLVTFMSTTLAQSALYGGLAEFGRETRDYSRELTEQSGSWMAPRYSEGRMSAVDEYIQRHQINTDTGITRRSGYWDKDDRLRRMTPGYHY